MLQSNMLQNDTSRSQLQEAEGGGIAELVTFALGFLRRQYSIIIFTAALAVATSVIKTDPTLVQDYVCSELQGSRDMTGPQAAKYLTATAKVQGISASQAATIVAATNVRARRGSCRISGLSGRPRPSARPRSRAGRRSRGDRRRRTMTSPSFPGRPARPITRQRPSPSRR